MTRGLLLDCDGVLVEMELDAHLRAFNRVWQEEGIPWRWTREAYSNALLTAGGRERLLALADCPEFLQCAGPLSRFGDWHNTTLRWHRRKTALLEQEIRTFGARARPGVRQLASEALAAGWQLAVVSAGAFETVQAIVDAVFGAQMATETVVVSAQDVRTKKPSPECYEVALDRCGLLAADAIAVEDSAHGLASARKAGLPCLITVTQATAEQEFEGALAVLDSLGEAPDRPVSKRLGTRWRPFADEVRLADVARLTNRTEGCWSTVVSR